MSNGTWIELWAPPNADDFVMPEELDLTQNGVKLKIERNNGIVYLYYNDTLIHTVYNFIPDSKQALKVGVTSERVNLVTYSNIKIEEVPLKKIKLNTPEVSLSGNILKIDETDFAENYYLFIDDEHQKIKVKVGENNINTILKELKMTDGTYKLKVFASNSDGERYENSDYSLETNYVFSTSLEALSKPVLSIDGSSIRFDKNENAKNYTMRIYVKSAMELGIDKENYVLVDAFDFDYAGIGYELNKLSEKLLTDEIYVFEVKANGDGTTYIDSDYSKRLEYQNKNAIFHEVKGSYIGSSNSLSLIKQETLDGDNYASTNRYDAAYFKTKYVNFSLSTLISNSDTTENVSEKYGITIAIDLNTYYDIFVVGNKIIALSQSGGTWVALWQTLYTIPDFERGNDVTLKVERKQDIITVYVNDILASTISNFTLGVDTEVNVGFTSEAISSIDYKNIEISELSK